MASEPPLSAGSTELLLSTGSQETFQRLISLSFQTAGSADIDTKSTRPSCGGGAAAQHKGHPNTPVEVVHFVQSSTQLGNLVGERGRVLRSPQKEAQENDHV